MLARSSSAIRLRSLLQLRSSQRGGGLPLNYLTTVVTVNSMRVWLPALRFASLRCSAPLHSCRLLAGWHGGRWCAARRPAAQVGWKLATDGRTLRGRAGWAPLYLYQRDRAERFD
jgi:hypothetical protein